MGGRREVTREPCSRRPSHSVAAVLQNACHQPRVPSHRLVQKEVSHQIICVIMILNYRDCSQCDKVEHRLKRALLRTKGKFRLCLIDSEIIDEQLRNAFKIHYTPSLFLFYRSNIAQEYRGKPSKDLLKDFVRAA